MRAEIIKTALILSAVSASPSSADEMAVYHGGAMRAAFLWCNDVIEPTPAGITAYLEMQRAVDENSPISGSGRLAESMEHNWMRNALFDHKMDGKAALDDYCSGALDRMPQYIKRKAPK